MKLSDKSIKEALETGRIEIDPLEDPDVQIQPASIDLRLGNEFIEFTPTNLPLLRPWQSLDLDKYSHEHQLGEGEELILHPGEFVLGTTSERVKLPDDLVGEINGRSSLGRLGLLVHATAGFIDPGWNGQITLEFANLGFAPIALKPGMRISQLTLTTMTTPAERPYGERDDSKYQNQEGPKASSVEDDPEFSQ